MGASKEAKNETIIGSGHIGGSYVNLQVWIGDPLEPTKGLTIPTESIDRFSVKENIFTMLPTLEMHIQDKDKFFRKHALCIGDMINIEMLPSPATKEGDEEDDDLDPFLMCSFVIQTISCVPDNENNTFTYVVLGIYAAQPLINEVSFYPTKGPLGLPSVYEKVESDKVIDIMATEAGLGLVCDCEPDDKSYWLNANETRGAFIERIIDHAWVGEGNAPVIYTDVFGTLHYTSIKNLCENATGVTFADMASNASAGAPKKSPTILFSQAKCLNAGGPILNRGGYTLKYSLMNPYNKHGIDEKEMPRWGVNGIAGVVNAGIGTDTHGTKDRSEGWREKSYSVDKTFIANVNNKQASEMDNVTIHQDGGMWFDELHTHYNIAPKHNEMVRRSFFTNFVNVAVDTSRQGSLYDKSAYRPELGDVVDVDFSSSVNNKIDSIHSGPYCVAEIVHKYMKKKPYTQSITFVNDGYFGK